MARALTATVVVGLGCICGLQVRDWSEGWSAPPTGQATELPRPAASAPARSEELAPELRAQACGSRLDDPEVVRPSLLRVLWARTVQLDERLHLTLDDVNATPELREGIRASLGPAPEHGRALRLLSEASDRWRGGLDHLAAASSVMGYRALLDSDEHIALQMAHVAEAADPTDALPWVIEALASSRMGEPRPEAMSRAFQLEPHEPAIALTTFLHFASEPELATPLRALDAYLAAVPGDVTLSRERSRLAMRYSIFHDATLRERPGIRVRGGSSPMVADRALALADDALWDASRLLHRGRPRSITLWLYPSHLALEDANCMTPRTAAFYDGGIHLDEPALHLEDGRTSLRHESVHAVLAGLPHPDWFGEGVAQYLAGEDPRGKRFEPMLRLRTWIPFASMNGPFADIDDPTDERLAYGQSLAMVLYLVDRRGEAGLADAVRYLEEGGEPGELMRGIGVPIDGETLLAFLERRSS